MEACRISVYREEITSCITAFILCWLCAETSRFSTRSDQQSTRIILNSKACSCTEQCVLSSSTEEPDSSSIGHAHHRADVPPASLLPRSHSSSSPAALHAPRIPQAGVWPSCYDDPNATGSTQPAPSTGMNIVKYHRAPEPLWHEWDRKAQKHGLRHTVYAVNGDQYTGEWLNNLKHGKGIQLWKSTRAIYSGDWKFGKRDGYGSFRIPDPVTKEYKQVYTGWWRNDRKCGYGTAFYPDGERYEGEWSSGLRSGWGRMYHQDGCIYEGQWLEDKPNGQGMLRLPNENRYEGGWKLGRKHGLGKYFYLDKGQLFEGIWAADIPKCGVLIDFGREEAPAPPQYPIPKIELADPDSVLAEAQAVFDDRQN